MYLGRAEIAAAVATGSLTLIPYRSDASRSASYVAHLDGAFRMWRATGATVVAWSPRRSDTGLGPVLDQNAVTVDPGGFVLSRTVERVGLPFHLAGVVSPLSHVARLGLSITLGSDWISPGFGHEHPTAITLEIVNHNPNPVQLEAGMPICHLRFCEVRSSAEVEVPRSVFEGGDGLDAPALWREFPEDRKTP